MKIGVSMWSYFRPWKEGRLDISGFIHEAKRAGAEGVELLDFFYKGTGTASATVLSQEDVAPERERAMAALSETGLPCPIFSVAQNFAKPTAEEREIQLRKILFGIREARQYGAGVVRVFAGDVAEGITFDQAREWIVEGLVQASQAAEEQGVHLALENHGTLAGRGDQVRGLIQDVRERSRTDALGANPDTGNFMLVSQPSHEAIREVAPYAYMVHFKDFAPAPERHDGHAYAALDGSRFVGTAVGDGGVDLQQCIEELRSAGFDGWLSVEYEGDEDPFTAVPRSIENARRYL
jgi:sugar phosphate isomerase/epimerase